jgi:hypothetical protein
MRSSFSFFTLPAPHNSMKSLAKSSHSSLQSTSSSTRATHHGTKHVKRGASASTIDRPLKRARHTLLSQVSSPVPSDEEGADQATEDQASVKTDKLLDIIRIESDDELDELEKDLGTSLFVFSLAISFNSIHSSGQGNLEICHIFLFQTRSHDRGEQGPRCPLLCLLCEEMQDQLTRCSALSRQRQQVLHR